MFLPLKYKTTSFQKPRVKPCNNYSYAPIKTFRLAKIPLSKRLPHWNKADVGCISINYDQTLPKRAHLLPFPCRLPCTGFRTCCKISIRRLSHPTGQYVARTARTGKYSCPALLRLVKRNLFPASTSPSPYMSSSKCLPPLRAKTQALTKSPLCSVEH